MTALPVGWAEAQLDELLASEPAAITDGPFGSNLKTEHYTTSGPRVIRLQNIGDGVFRDERAHISAERFEALKKHEARSGDVVIAALGEVLPRACVVPSHLGPAIVKADCIRLRLNEEVNPLFVNAMLNSPPVRRAASAEISGVGRPRLNLAKIRSIRLPVPPRAEQDRIVAAIEEQCSRLDAADAALRSGRRRLLSLPSRLIDRSLSGFPTKPLGELIREPLRNGHSAKRMAGGDIPVFTLTAVTARDFSARNTKLTAADRGRVEDLWVEPGDIFVERSNTPELVGTAALYDGPPRSAIFPDLLIRVRVGPSLLPEFAELALRSTRIRRHFQQRAKGIAGSMPKIDQATILEAEVPVPSIDVQERLVAEVDRGLSLTQELSSAIARALTRSDHLRRSVLTEAFFGRLVLQDPSDEPASELLARIAAERPPAPKPRQRKRA